jgi:WD40 repeat protein
MACAFFSFLGFCTVAVVAAQAPAPTERLLALSAQPIAGAVSENGEFGAFVSNEKKLRVLKLADGKVLQTIEVPTVEIERMSISSNGAWVFIGDHDGRITLWNAASGKVQMQSRMAHYAGAQAFSRDGKRVAIAPASDPVQVFDTSTGSKICETSRVLGGVQSMAFSRDGSLLATGDSDTAVRIYDAGSGKLIAQNTDFVLEPLAVTFSADGKQVIASGADKVIVFLDAATGVAKRKLAKLNQPVSWSSMTVSPDGKSFSALLMQAEDLTKPGTVLVWDLATGEKQLEWTPATNGEDLTWSKDGHLFLFGGQATSLRIWKIR